MPRYKVGEKIVVGLVEVTVVRGSCESCFFNFFNKHKGVASCMLDKERCIKEIGFDNCYKVLREGL